ncbi:hypothetical protein JJC04_08760 [Flavobacterium covae]|nr:hypothetical protein [Flavobacterium covae]QYS90282.1 hypothetical protein JJC04_08760 [Flavobacterium covae]
MKLKEKPIGILGTTFSSHPVLIATLPEIELYTPLLSEKLYDDTCP